MNGKNEEGERERGVTVRLQTNMNESQCQWKRE